MGQDKKTSKRESHQLNVSTVDSTNTVNADHWIGISDDQARKIMALLDDWIEECERTGEGLLNVPTSSLRESAGKLQDAISSMKKYRDSIQSSNQSWWALAMLWASHTATMRAQLNKRLGQTVQRLEANLNRFEAVINRQQQLEARIEELGSSVEDLSSCRSERKKLRDWYTNEFGIGKRTFREDFKALGGKPK